MTDEMLLALLYQSPEEGRAALFRAYYGLVYTIVHGRLRHVAKREDEEECISDVFADLFLALDETPTDDLRRLVCTVASRRAIDAWRTLSRSFGRTVPLEDMPEMTSGEDPAAAAEKSAVQSHLLDAIAALGEPDATIVIWRYWYERNATEIAAALHMKPAAVRKRLSRALKTLRGMLDKEAL